MSELDKKRISLKSCQDWNKWIQGAFQAGRCECTRCKENEYDESTYTYKHSFEINGEVYARKFANTSREDLESFLKKAWVSFYNLDDEKAEYYKKNFYDISHPMEEIYEFTLPEIQSQLSALVSEINGVKTLNNVLVFV